MDVLLLIGCNELNHTNCIVSMSYSPPSGYQVQVDGDKDPFPSQSNANLHALPISMNNFSYKMLVTVWFTFQDLRLLRIDTLTAVQLSWCYAMLPGLIDCSLFWSACSSGGCKLFCLANKIRCCYCRVSYILTSIFSLSIDYYLYYASCVSISYIKFGGPIMCFNLTLKMVRCLDFYHKIFFFLNN
jgi:hypothetical protein